MQAQAIQSRFGQTTKGGSDVSAITSFLGVPSKAVRFDAEDNVSKEFFSVADTYRGRNVYLEKTISSLVASSHNAWVLQRFFRLEQYNDINFSSKVLKANRTLFPRTAPHAPPAYVSAKEVTLSATMGRYELGFLVPIETLDTADGQAKARLHIANCAAALGDTMEQVGAEGAAPNPCARLTRYSNTFSGTNVLRVCCSYIFPVGGGATPPGCIRVAGGH